MTNITLTITGAKAKAIVNGPLTSGMVGIPVTIAYDHEWAGLTKNLVCRCSQWGPDRGETRTVLNVGKSATVAHEVMKGDMNLYLGVEGYSADGKLVMPTTWAECGKIRHGANTGADLSADPQLPVWAQVLTELKKLKQQSVTEAQLTAGIAAYLEENHIDTPDFPTEFTSLTLISPDGSKWDVTVDNAGNMGAVKLTEDDSGEEEPDEPEVPVVATYTVVSGLTNVESSNASAVVNEGESYTATLTAMAGYELYSVIVTMGGVDITATAYADGVVDIASVTADVVITATAKVADNSLEESDIDWYTVTPSDFTDPVISGSTIYLKTCNITDSSINAVAFPATMTDGDTTYSTVNLYQVNFADTANIEYIKFEPGIVGTGITFPTATIKQVFGLENVPLTNVPTSFNGAANLVKAPVLPATITQTSYTGGTFMNCDSLVDVSDFVIPASITTIGPWFAQCDNLEYGCTIPATVTTGTTQFYWKTPKLRHTRVESKTCPVSGNFVTGLDNAVLVNECEIELYPDSAFFSGLKELAYAYNGIDRHVYLTPIDGTIRSISVFGDSLTQGQITDNYPKALTAKLSTDSIVWNMGVSGSTMEQQLQRMRDYPQKMKADVIVQWGGSNASAATQSVDAYIACLDEMIALFETDKYIIITPTDHTYSADRDAACAEKYGNHYLNLVDYFEGKGYTRSEYQTDNLHFTAEGYGIVAQAIYEKGQSLGYWE